MAFHKRAFTLMESLVTVSLSAVVIGAAATLYGFAAKRSMADASRLALTAQVNGLAEDLSATIEQSSSCIVVPVGSSTALVCLMPNAGMDLNGDGIVDIAAPTTVDGAGNEVFGTGKYVWLYTANSTGSIGTQGGTLWRSVLSTATLPTLSDLDLKWSKYYGGASRWNSVDSINFAVDPVAHTTTFTISASTLQRAERSAVGESSANGYSVTVSRTVYWRNYR